MTLFEDIFGGPLDRSLTEMQEQRLVVLHAQLLADKEKLTLRAMEHELSTDTVMEGLELLLDLFRLSLRTNDILTDEEIEENLGPAPTQAEDAVEAPRQEESASDEIRRMAVNILRERTSEGEIEENLFKEVCRRVRIHVQTSPPRILAQIPGRVSRGIVQDMNPEDGLTRFVIQAVAQAAWRVTVKRIQEPGLPPPSPFSPFSPR